jgi:F-type H+-transporting ATPase subunit epsilon
MSAATFRLDIVSPDRQVLSEEVEEAQVPGKNGYLGILPGHAPLLTELGIGELSYRQGDRTGYLAVACGYCEVASAQVTVLAERAEPAEEVDRKRAQTSMDRAQKRLSNLHDPDIDFVRAGTSLQRALIRVQVSRKAGRPSAKKG